MSARTEPASWPQPRAGSEGEGTALVWLDALAGGICTAEAFLGAMQEQFQEDREKSWEVLSLLDQYYRRGKINADLFHTIKSSLESTGLQGDADLTASRRPHAPAAPVTAPAAASPNQASSTLPSTSTTPAPASPNQVSPTLPSTPAPASPNQASPTLPSTPAPASPNQLSPTLPIMVPPASLNQASSTSPNRTPPASPRQASATLPNMVPPPLSGRAPPTLYDQVPATSPAKAPSTLPDRAPPVSRPEAREVRELAIGDLLRGRYRIRGVLGHGGMGTVFDAIDEYRLDLPTSGQRIAIKVLHTAVTQREDLLAELQREFQHLQLLSHPNIVRVHEFDRDDDNAFFTMESLIGALLNHVLDSRNAVALPRPYALAVMRDVGAALAHAHSRGVAHGDINPQNIFITNDGEVRVLDFGASRKLDQHPDARDDLFAFACVTYLLLSGRHPFPGRTAAEARARRVHPPRPPALTGRQWRVLREGLRWERDRRPADVQKWLDRFGLAAAAPRLPPLPALMDAPPPRKHGAGLTAAVIAIFALLAAGGYWAVTNYDSLARVFTPATPVVTQQAPPPSVPESAPAPRANPTPTPRVTAPKTGASKI